MKDLNLILILEFSFLNVLMIRTKNYQNKDSYNKSDNHRSYNKDNI